MIGELDRRIALQNFTSTQAADGEMTRTWSTAATVWAWVRFGSGSERMIADKNTVVGDCIFTIRYRTGVTEKTRIVLDSVNYDIVHIAERDRKMYLELTAKKVV